MKTKESLLEKVLDTIGSEIVSARAGNRQTILSKASYTLGGYIPSGLISEYEAKEYLQSCVNCNPEFYTNREDWNYTIDYSLRKGMEEPFDIEINDNAGSYRKPKMQRKAKPKYLPEKPAIFDYEKVAETFDDYYEIEERAAIIEYDGGFNELQAEQEAIKCYGLNNLENRIFHYCVSWQTHNKDIIPYPNHFEPVATTYHELQNFILQGLSFAPAVFSPEESKDVLAYKDKKHWQQSELIVLDIDSCSGMEEMETVIEKANEYDLLFAYTTPSHTPESPRFRLVFFLDYIDTDVNRYSRAVKSLGKLFNSDVTDNHAKSYFGNTNALFTLGKAVNHG